MIRENHKYNVNVPNKRNWPGRVILVFILIAVFHPYIANERPLYCKIDGKHMFPVNKSIFVELGLSNWGEIQDYNWGQKEYEKKIMPLIPYSYNTLDSRNTGYKSPFDNQVKDNFWQHHWMGTDLLGRDVFAGILKGTEIAVKIGFISASFACLVALIFGLSAAVSKRFPSYLNAFDILLIILSLPLLFYLTWLGIMTAKTWFFGLLLLVLFANSLYFLFIKRKLDHKLKWKIEVPVDGVFLRLVEAMRSIPSLIFLLAGTTIFPNVTVKVLIIILSFLMWPGLARYIRAEALKVLAQDYVMAAQLYGASKWRIVIKHVLPKTFTSLSVVLAFLISSAVVVESTLSFLGLGIPIDQVSWGLLLKEARMNFSAWWMALFPGIAMFILILSLNVYAEELEQNI